MSVSTLSPSVALLHPFSGELRTLHLARPHQDDIHKSVAALLLTHLSVEKSIKNLT